MSRRRRRYAWAKVLGAVLLVLGLPYLIVNWPDVVTTAQTIGAWIDGVRTAVYGLAPWMVI